MTPSDDASLTWTTRPLEQALTVLGVPRLSLTVSADQPVALVSARVEHVHEDGRSTMIARGVLNLTRRESFEQPAPLEPDRPYDVVVPLMGAGVTIPANGRLRLALSGVEFPLVWPPPQPATLTVHAGTLQLPAPDADEEVPAPTLPEPVPGPPNPVIRDGPEPRWKVERDVDAGMTRSRFTTGWTAHLPEDGLSVGSEDVVAEVGDEDPLSARAVSTNVATVRHDGVTAHARSRLEVRCTATSFVTAVDLTVERDGQIVFERRWEDEAPRDLM
jgi:hypothetical protein